jgi:hypothetical protein
MCLIYLPGFLSASIVNRRRSNRFHVIFVAVSKMIASSEDRERACLQKRGTGWIAEVHCAGERPQAVQLVTERVPQRAVLASHASDALGAGGVGRNLQGEISARDLFFEGTAGFDAASHLVFFRVQFGRGRKDFPQAAEKSRGRCPLFARRKGANCAPSQ